MSGAGLFICPSAWLSRAPSPHFPGFSSLARQRCCQEAGAPPPRGPGRRWLSYLLYAGLAAVLGFVLWQQWQA
ncbi:hypothetical protein GCM10027422_33950 [Hymenobacter arcticus]